MPPRLDFRFDKGVAHAHPGAGDTEYALHHPDRLLYVRQSAHAPGTGVKVERQELDVELAGGLRLLVDMLVLTATSFISGLYLRRRKAHEKDAEVVSMKELARLIGPAF